MNSNIKKLIARCLTGFIFVTAAPVVMAFETGFPTDVDTRELRTVIIESWEKDLWVVKGEPGDPQSKIEIKILDGIPKDLSLDSGNKRSFGIRFNFIYPGDNTLIITPPEGRKVIRTLPLLDDKTGKPKTEEVPGIELPGIVKAMSVWVLGRGEDYTMEAWIEDGRGDTHIFKFGSLNYVGWRPLTINIPSNVIQEDDTYPQTRGLILKKLIIRSTPKTKANQTVFVFDSLKVLSDMSQAFFDGADINFDEQDKAEKEKMKQYTDQLRQSSQSNNGGAAK